MALENCKLEMKSNTVSAVLCYLKLESHHMYHYLVPGLHVLKILSYQSSECLQVLENGFKPPLVEITGTDLQFYFPYSNVDANTKVL